MIPAPLLDYICAARRMKRLPGLQPLKLTISAVFLHPSGVLLAAGSTTVKIAKNLEEVRQGDLRKMINGSDKNTF